MVLAGIQNSDSIWAGSTLHWKQRLPVQKISHLHRFQFEIATVPFQLPDEKTIHCSVLLWRVQTPKLQDCTKDPTRQILLSIFFDCDVMWMKKWSADDKITANKYIDDDKNKCGNKKIGARMLTRPARQPRSWVNMGNKQKHRHNKYNYINVHKYKK